MMKKTALFTIIFFLGCADGYWGLDFPPAVPGIFAENFSWTNVDTDGDGVAEDYVTPIRRQTGENCYIYSAVAALEVQYNIDNKIDLNEYEGIDLSEYLIETCLNLPMDKSWSAFPVMSYLYRRGAFEEGVVDEGICPFYEPATIRGAVYRGVPQGLWREQEKRDFTEIKDSLVKELQTGPLTLSVSNFKNLAINTGGEYYCNDGSDKQPSGHLILVVGYKDSGSILLIKNSHGGNSLMEVVFDETAYTYCGVGGDANRFSPGLTIRVEAEKVKELYESTPPGYWDLDADGVADVDDNCPWEANAEQEDSDEDGYGDSCDRCKNYAGYTPDHSCPKKIKKEHTQ